MEIHRFPQPSEPLTEADTFYAACFRLGLIAGVLLAACVIQAVLL